MFTLITLIQPNTGSPSQGNKAGKRNGKKKNKILLTDMLVSVENPNKSIRKLLG